MQQITMGQLGFRKREREERGGIALKFEVTKKRMIYDMLVKTCSDLFATVN